MSTFNTSIFNFEHVIVNWNKFKQLEAAALRCSLWNEKSVLSILTKLLRYDPTAVHFSGWELPNFMKKIPSQVILKFPKQKLEQKK